MKCKGAYLDHEVLYVRINSRLLETLMDAYPDKEDHTYMLAEKVLNEAKEDEELA